MKKVSTILALLLSGYATYVPANVILHGTRVIFPSDKQEVSLRIENDNTLPVLVQTWVDDGNSTMSANMPKTPFIITPPMFRMESKQGQSLRIIYNGSSLAKDRESVFWVNVFEIPPTEVKNNQNSLQLAFRSRIKLFYRPADLVMPNTDELSKQMQCTGNKETAQLLVLSCKNTSPYYLSFSQVNISVMINNQSVIVPIEQFSMIAPFSTYNTKVKVPESTVPMKLNYFLINDLGGAKEYTATL
ncbi:molecular chaperone [Yersinia intermedia]|uniref:fimbrial biogenesis chaperone n=1 Tax=Yersinia intermedia TaxID=631 RepID=UPI0022FDF993|nr:fimbria/pilus periplasmic chaperone [Yersinia intermedia]MDA5519074.1 fimbria/pilus periplasmic chaperone [Yersinia intermedia]